MSCCSRSTITLGALLRLPSMTPAPALAANGTLFAGGIAGRATRRGTSRAHLPLLQLDVRPLAIGATARGLAGWPCPRILQRVRGFPTGGLGTVTFRRRSVTGFSVRSADSGLGRIDGRITTRRSWPLGKLRSAALLMVSKDLRFRRHEINLATRAAPANHKCN